mmetsp:Transcript_15241/g.32887  ORF Transcript_15241/g.32887 Transcript_15241/m.32887 type:complete len:178 (-) Transcript_15241:373-906(-)
MRNAASDTYRSSLPIDGHFPQDYLSSYTKQHCQQLQEATSGQFGKHSGTGGLLIPGLRMKVAGTSVIVSPRSEPAQHSPASRPNPIVSPRARAVGGAISHESRVRRLRVALPASVTGIMEGQEEPKEFGDGRQTPRSRNYKGKLQGDTLLQPDEMILRGPIVVAGADYSAFSGARFR